MRGTLLAAQQLQIAAIYERDGIADEPNGFAARGRVLPFDGPEQGVFGAEHLGGDVAWATASVVNVKGVQELNQPPFLQRGEPQGGRKQADVAAVKAVDEAQRNVEPHLEDLVDGQHHGGSLGGVVASQPDVQRAESIPNDPLAAIGIDAVREDRSESPWVEGGARVEAGRCRLEDQRGWRMLRQPDRWLTPGRNAGIVDKTAIPSAGRVQTGPSGSTPPPAIWRRVRT